VSGQGALGIIETQGRASLIEAVDSAIKAAQVRILASYFVGGGFNTVTLVGDVGSMRAALDAAQAVFGKQGIPGLTHLIPRLAEQVWPFLDPAEVVKTVPAAQAAGKERVAAPPKGRKRKK
jgi:energy-coupling factor transport system substrate-specific component